MALQEAIKLWYVLNIFTSNEGVNLIRKIEIQRKRNNVSE